MGNVNFRSSKQEEKAERPAQKQPQPTITAHDGFDTRLSLRRPSSKAKGAVQRLRRPGLFSCYEISPDPDEDDLPLPQVRQQLQSQRHLHAAEALQRQQNMDEVIYIPDDDDIPPARRQRHRVSLTSKALEYVSAAPANRRQSEQDRYDPAPPQQETGIAPGHEVPELSQVAAYAEPFMDDEDFDWTQFVNDQDSALAGNVPGMNPGADPGVMFGFNQRSLGIPVLPADPMARRSACIDEVMTVFPDMCRDYVSGLYDDGVGQLSEQLTVRILDNIEKGIDYPKARDKLKILKRKRERNPEEEEEQTYGSADREDAGYDYAAITRQILSGEFSDTPMTFIDATLSQTKRLLFPAYRILEEAERTWTIANPPYNRIKSHRKMNRFYYPEEAEKALKSEATTPELMEALRELKAARRVRQKAEEKREAERKAELAEEENVRKAEAEGTMLDCGCCFDLFPLNRMVHCENDPMHWFCRNCAKQTAETEIGNQKYQIICMSMDGCEATFSKSQKAIFLDEKALIALDRNEQEAMLRLAGIENLESCPFCPFAAEYPPIEENKEFRCQAEDCEKVSCRLCRLNSHIPKTCEESAKDNGLSIRRQIEEAMSAALIRKCNNCGTPFVKEEGCNKMTCTRSGCRNVQCYVCSKSCTYDHFNDRSRGGKPGNCPLFESVEERHEQEVSRAEKEALDRVRAEHPEYTEDDLRIKVSQKVKEDEEKRRVNDPRNPVRAGVVAAAFVRLGQGAALVPAQAPRADPLPGQAGRAERDRDLAFLRARQMQFAEPLPFAEHDLELMLGLMPDPEFHGRAHGWEDFAFNPPLNHPPPAGPMEDGHQDRINIGLEQIHHQQELNQQELGVQQPAVWQPLAQELLQNAPMNFYDHIDQAQAQQHHFLAGQQQQRGAQFRDLEAGREQLRMQQQQLLQARRQQQHLHQHQPQQGVMGHAQGIHREQMGQARLLQSRIVQPVPPPAMPVRPLPRRQQ